jgi:hypothetical protein
VVFELITRHFFAWCACGVVCDRWANSSERRPGYETIRSLSRFGEASRLLWVTQFQSSDPSAFRIVPISAFSASQSAKPVDVLTLTTARAVGGLAVIVALVSIGMALLARRRGHTRRGAYWAVLGGVVGIALGTVVVLGAKGGLGTGQGLGGGILGAALGLVSLTWGTIALKRGLR